MRETCVGALANELVTTMSWKLLTVGLLITGIGGCAPLNAIRYFSPTIEDSTVPALSAAGGIAFSVGSMCLYISDASRIVVPMAATFVGIPVLPTRLSDGIDADPDYLDIELWLLPPRGSGEYSFDVRLVALELDNGSVASAHAVQVSRFRVVYVPEQTYMFTPDMAEKVSHAEHQEAKALSNFTEPTQLWGWTRLTFRFARPNQRVKFLTRGLFRAGEAQEAPVVGLAIATSNRVALPGQLPDGTPIGWFPDKACRKLQNESVRAP